jgi:tRNA threonylcarbamoyladenosine biosynthesis protein TsaE
MLDGLQQAAQEIATHITDERNIVAFYGAMGSGKTTLIRAICSHLGVVENVTSPTFALVNEYHTSDNRTIFHFDFYRINNIAEVYDLGYEEYFYSKHICFIEWAEYVEDLLPNNALSIHIKILDNNTREFLIDD